MRRRAPPPATTFLLPPWLRIRRLHEAVSVSLAVFLGYCAVRGFPMAGPGPKNPFIALNGLGIMVEAALCLMLANRRTGRRLAAILLAILAPLAGVCLVLMQRSTHWDVISCVWFVPTEMSLGPRFAILGILLVLATLVFLREETRAQDRTYGPEVGDARALDRLTRPFQ
jgi:hypothetical protein